MKNFKSLVHCALIALVAAAAFHGPALASAGQSPLDAYIQAASPDLSPDFAALDFAPSCDTRAAPCHSCAVPLEATPCQHIRHFDASPDTPAPPEIAGLYGQYGNEVNEFGNGPIGGNGCGSVICETPAGDPVAPQVFPNSVRCWQSAPGITTCSDY